MAGLHLSQRDSSVLNHPISKKNAKRPLFEDALDFRYLNRHNRKNLKKREMKFPIVRNFILHNGKILHTFTKTIKMRQT